MKAFMLVFSLLSIALESRAEEFGATGVWIVDRKSAGEPVRTGMVWTNSPAHKAGIKGGLFVIAVNGTNVVSKPVVDVMSMVRGPAGGVVTLDLADAELTRTNKSRSNEGEPCYVTIR